MAKEANIPPFMEEGFNSFKQFKFPGIDMGAFLSSYQKNMELMNTTQKIALETTQSVMELQQQYFKRLFDQCNEAVKSGSSQASFAEKATSQAESAKTKVEEAIKHVHDVNTTIAKSNGQIIESIQKHFKEVLEESSDFAKKSRASR